MINSSPEAGRKTVVKKQQGEANAGSVGANKKRLLTKQKGGGKLSRQKSLACPVGELE